MMKRIWIRRCKDFRSADEFNLNYYLSMSADERIETMQFLRELLHKIKKDYYGKDRKGLRRVIKVTKQT
ncbi:MAG: hypothetical protein Fur0020_10410 [Thermodesulfovibrionia bacterium]